MSVITPDTVPQDLVEELRNQFLNELNKGSLDIHPKDLERAKTDDFWLKRFLAHHDNNTSIALKMMTGALSWRKKFGANDVSESNINMDLARVGALFPHGKDLDGKHIFVIRVKKHIRGAFPMEEIKRVVVYWMERLEVMTNGDIITVFFDLDGAGLRNLDMDFIKYLISLLNENYPYFLNYIIVFELPWVLNAAFKIIKSWLPPKAVEKMRFLGKKDITTYVPANEALISWGGTNNYEFEFIAEQKKVHFSASPATPNGTVTNYSQKKENGCLRVNPSGILTFVQQGSETIGTVELTNIDSSNNISFKLKTTSPEKFRVKPSSNILHPNENVKITVTVLSGYQMGNLDREKFLIMYAVLNEKPDTIDLVQFWKTIPSDKVLLQRLKCVHNSKEKKKAPSIPENNDLQIKLVKSLQRIERLLTSLLVLLIVVVIAIFYIFYARNVQSKPENAFCPIRDDSIL